MNLNVVVLTSLKLISLNSSYMLEKLTVFVKIKKSKITIKSYSLPFKQDLTEMCWVIGNNKSLLMLKFISVKDNHQATFDSHCKYLILTILS